MHRHLRFPYLLVLLAAITGTARAQGTFGLHSGDRVVFYGDSITDQRLYTTFVEEFVVTRFPGMNVRFVHSGWGGDRVTGGGGGPVDVRLDRDVIAYKPTVMTIMLGMNDGSYRAFDPGIFDTYARGYEHILDKVKQALPGIRLTLILPSPYDDVTRAPRFEGGYNAVLVRYGQFVQELAEKQKASVADMNTPVVAALEKANSLDAAQAQKIVPDRVHPAPGGHLLMAEALLKAWNAPSVVSAVTIDAAAKRATREENTRVSELRGESSLSWTQADRALPIPLNLSDPIVDLALRSSDFVAALDQQPLQVNGLTSARYMLKIDGAEVASFTKEQLAEGINLAVLQTPMLKQAMSVHMLTLGHNNIHNTRWRQIQVPLQNSPAQIHKAIETLDAAEEELVKQQRAAAQPKARRYELTPAG
jgi:lysophospholipase L1-like esterase